MIYLAIWLMGCNPMGSDTPTPTTPMATDAAQPATAAPATVTPAAPEAADPIQVGVQPGSAATPSQATPAEGPTAGITADQCNTLTDGGPLLDDCITAEIACGETVVGHTRGGVERFDTRFYEKKFCTPSTTNHNGGDERVYRLQMPDGDNNAMVYLDTPCADLDLAALRWNDEGCPTIQDGVRNCEMWPKDGRKRERVKLVSTSATAWLIVVEGKDDHEGAFSLHVECNEGLQ